MPYLDVETGVGLDEPLRAILAQNDDLQPRPVEVVALQPAIEPRPLRDAWERLRGGQAAASLADEGVLRFRQRFAQLVHQRAPFSGSIPHARIADSRASSVGSVMSPIRAQNVRT